MDDFIYTSELTSPYGVDPSINPVSDYDQCLVRFLNAAPNSGAVHISIGSQTYVSDLEYGIIEPYQRVDEGIKTVQIISNDSSRMVLYKQTMAFRPKDKFMISVVETDQGIGIHKVPEAENIKNSRKLGSMRVVNLSYNTHAYDLVLNDNRIVYSDIHYLETTLLKYGRVGAYDLYLSQTPLTLTPIIFDVNNLDEYLTIKDGYNYVTSYKDSLQPVLTFTVELKSNTLSTIYIIGNYNEEPQLNVLIAENR